MSKTDFRLLLLSDDDNIFVLGECLDAGETVQIEGESMVVPMHLALGHKLARVPINQGDKILKYGLPIGTASQSIPRGDHVHTHNITSNYTKAHTLYDAKTDFGDNK